MSHGKGKGKRVDPSSSVSINISNGNSSTTTTLATATTTVDPLHNYRITNDQREMLVDWMAVQGNRDLIYNHKATKGMTIRAAYDIMATDLRHQFQQRPHLLGDLTIIDVTGPFVNARWNSLFRGFKSWVRDNNKVGPKPTGQGVLPLQPSPTPTPTLASETTAANEMIYERLLMAFHESPVLMPPVTRNIGYVCMQEKIFRLF